MLMKSSKFGKLDKGSSRNCKLASPYTYIMIISVHHENAKRDHKKDFQHGTIQPREIIEASFLLAEMEEM